MAAISARAIAMAHNQQKRRTIGYGEQIAKTPTNCGSLHAPNALGVQACSKDDCDGVDVVAAIH